MIRTPVEICEARVARIVGQEWGPESKSKTAGNGWLCYVQFYVSTGAGHVAPSEGYFTASEEEIVSWQKQGG